MQVSLHITEGPYQGETISVPAGTSLIIGRTDIADRSFPNDLQMSSRHLEINFDGQMCRLKDLGSTNGSFVNHQRISEHIAQTGDSLTAGNSTFLINVEAAGAAPGDVQGTMGGAVTPPAPAPVAAPAPPPPPPAPQPAPAPVQAAPAPAPAPAPTAAAPQPQAMAADTPPAAGEHDHDHAAPAQPDVPSVIQPEQLTDSTSFVSASAADICSIFEPTDSMKAILQAQPELNPKGLVDLLVQGEMLEDAIEFIAHALPSRAAVGWASKCVRQTGGLSPADEEALGVCDQWLLSPNESVRRQAEAKATALEHGTPAAWVAMGVVWSHGSIGPAEAPAIGGTPDLKGKAIAGAVKMAAVITEPEKAADKQKSFVDLGLMLGSA